MEFPKDNEVIPGSSFQNEEGVRSCRFKKRQSDPTCCPVCSVTIRESEINLHLNSEIDKLNKLHNTKSRINTKNIPSSSNGPSKSSDKSWETFQKVRSNRQSRHRTRTRKRKPEEICPVCNKEVNEDLTLHVDLCLRRSETNGSESDENIDVEAFEEYEWAGQSRIRATSLLEGGISNLGTSVTMADEDEDLNVDVDDVPMYGSPQYSENDVIFPCETPENVALRKAVTGIEPKKCSPNRTDIEVAETNGDPILEVLKNRIKELESKDSNKEGVFKCLICMEQYRTPVISVCCWHVHCEECWLKTLGVKKLCPQCNMITSPSDLRKIYI
ncbi:E3 ubiquitin-protein ligase RNF220-like [Diorhabda carinulata]|uniref:E3 ubiquitin-protein ligase RNF220-like n=1 Tax=Diorhabda sublineata TaxID=1163346 RepID=UPI0024E04714|nr:E3 ubiquitin-protein ligase RNF220-like [Diorhabda sublineata]XP_057672852.1 E3 ubiquitin-protein ligase RNF220-like [Diorhabda carinulata]